MNFLSHYYCELPYNKPLFVAGLIVPDLTPGFSKIYNQLIKKAGTPSDEGPAEVHKGILAHYDADKRFHNSEMFLHFQKLTTAEFVNAVLNRQRLRLSVLAHIAVELMIDRQIVIQQPDVCNEFYSNLDNATQVDLIAYYKLHRLETEVHVFLRNFNFFSERRFLFMLKDLTNVVEALNRIMGRAIKTEFTGAEKLAVQGALGNIDAIMRYRWQEILKA